MITRLKRRKRERSGIERVPPRKFLSHRQWVRGFPCSVENDECSEKIQAHHVRKGLPANAQKGGAGMLPHDAFTGPLCAFHHIELHGAKMGETRFDLKYGVCMYDIAVDLAKRSRVREVRDAIARMI